jgi:hypothetical protein
MMFHKLSVGSVALLALGLGLSSAAVANDNDKDKDKDATVAVCADASVAPKGGFNNDAVCPKDKKGSFLYATGGGYELVVFPAGDLQPVEVDVSFPLFGGLGGVQPIGWQAIGTSHSILAATIRTCVLCLTHVEVKK